MKILETKSAPNPRRVRIFLAEKGIDVPYEQVDLFKGGHKEASFTSKNPVAKVPVLELDDGTCISESVAICRYFEEQHPEPPLMGVDAKDKAIVEMWQRRIELEVFYPIAQAFRHGVAGMKTLEPIQLVEWVEINRARALEAYAWLDKDLADRKYVAGDRFTIADITLLVAVDFARGPKIPIPEDCKNLLRWHDDVSKRPSAAA